MSEVSDPIFARIAHRYDLINRILSLGQDQNWRRRAIRHLPAGWVIDLGSGTGAASEALADRSVVALDPVAQMLSLSTIRLRVVGVGEAMPFVDESFSGVFSAFVFRNLTSVPATLGEIERVLEPGGAAVILDLSRPSNAVAAWIHRVGSAIALPLAGLIAGAPRDYWYLHKSLDSLPQPAILYRDAPLEIERLERMGPLGFVYAMVLRKPS